MEKNDTKNGGANGVSSFPSASTLTVGLWLLFYTIATSIALFMAFGSGFIIKYQNISGIASPLFFKEAFIAIYSAGIGSAITTILGYLDHACVTKDFKVSYVPWYFARPIIGMLLGIIFYFVLRSGLIIIQSGQAVSMAQPFNLWSLATISALVGLFSKNAVEKLRELFNTMFNTKNDIYNDLLERLPPDIRKIVQPYIKKESKKDEVNTDGVSDSQT